MLIYRFLILGLICLSTSVQAQEGSLQHTVFFYNVENLFLPTAERHGDSTVVYDKPGWTRERYNAKIRDLATVLRQFGKKHNTPGPDMVGLCEVENVTVLRDLVSHPVIRDADYGILHFDSPDERGIDVALLYRRSVFLPESFHPRPLHLRTKEGYRDRSRDILVVSGYLDDERIHLLVNHWPSRRGGAQRSEPLRQQAGLLARSIADSINKLYPQELCIVMGDFNDNPDDLSVRRFLYSYGEKKEKQEAAFYNPFYLIYRRGLGSIAYRDRWYLFDQILVRGRDTGYDPYKFNVRASGIFNPSRLRTSKGAFKGYPLRTYTGKRYTAGYSDHFPVYILLEKKIGSGEPDIIRHP